MSSSDELTSKGDSNNEYMPSNSIELTKRGRSRPIGSKIRRKGLAEIDAIVANDNSNDFAIFG